MVPFRLTAAAAVQHHLIGPALPPQGSSWAGRRHEREEGSAPLCRTKAQQSRVSRVARSSMPVPLSTHARGSLITALHAHL
eukprot:3926763-Pyramimonas_sp.AAC.1